VRNPKLLKLKDNGVNIQKKLFLSKHPMNEIQGERVWDLDELDVYIETEDLEYEEIRLKDFVDIEVRESIGLIQSINRTDKRPIVHWIPKSIGKNAILTIPKDNKIIIQEGMMEDFQIIENNIVQLERVGYAKIESNKEIIKLLWLHD
jgi:hypothetical protein